MKEMNFKNARELWDWQNDGNDIYPFYDGWNDRPTYFILQSEVDELFEYEERYGVQIIEQDDNGVFLKAHLNDKQYNIFCEAHCVKLCIHSYLQETIAILSGDCWDTIYKHCDNDTFETASIIQELAYNFEEKYDWFIDGKRLDGYIELLDDYILEVLKQHQS